MEDQLDIRVHSGVAVVTLGGPALDAALRAGIMAALERLAADIDVHAVVLLPAAQGWPGSALPDTDSPSLAELCAAVEDFPRPVIAALHGRVIGAGLDLALAAHIRVAQRGTAYGAPQITYGLVPWGGATQRLPRLVGAGPAMDLLLSGAAIGTAQAEKIGLVDIVSRGDLEAVALATADEMRGTDPRRSADGRALLDDAALTMAAVRARRDGLIKSRLDAPAKIIDCVEAALLLPFEAGMAFEQTAFEDAYNSDQSQALRHLALAEPIAAKVTGARPPQVPLKKVAIIGASGIGQGLAIACLSAGLDVALIEAQETLRAQASERIRAAFDQAVQRGQLNGPEAEGKLNRLALGPGLSLAASAMLGIEAVAESQKTKIDVLTAVQSTLPQGATLITKSVYLDLPGIAAALPDGTRLVGMRFHTPAHMMRLVELSALPVAAPEALGAAEAFAQLLGKQIVTCAGQPGLVCERLIEACRSAADVCVEEGASPAEVDHAMIRFGFPRGLYQAIDGMGVDAVLAQRRAHAPNARGIGLAEALVAAGFKGHGRGPGWLLPGDNGPTDASPTLQVIEAWRAGQDIAPRRLSRGEIQRRCLAAMINEGAKMIESGAVPGAAALDVGAVMGLGFPRWKGGPMKSADQWGLLRVDNALRSLQDNAPDLYTPAPLIGELIKNGRHFSDLQG